MNVLFLGDLVGLPGCSAVLDRLPSLIQETQADLVIVNAENASSNGLGLTPGQFHALRRAGADVVTTGNHVWESEDLRPSLDGEPRLLRPDNYPTLLPGRGWCVVEKQGWAAAVVNLQGRSRMAMIDDPFAKAEVLVSTLKETTPLIFVDFHAEASDEKEAFGYWLDGKATAVAGTHTHVATADERILPRGTAFQTDLGMCGPASSVIGSDPSVAVERALTLVPHKADVASGPVEIHGLLVVADRTTGRAVRVGRVLA